VLRKETLTSDQRHFLNDAYHSSQLQKEGEEKVTLTLKRRIGGD
jgi:hypothetical protein